MSKYLITKSGKPTNGLMAIVITLALSTVIIVGTTGADEVKDAEIYSAQSN